MELAILPRFHRPSCAIMRVPLIFHQRGFSRIIQYRTLPARPAPRQKNDREREVSANDGGHGIPKEDPGNRNPLDPLADGVQLAARVWMPEDAEQNPVPAILEYIPYRRRDGTRDGDDLTHPYFAGHGYACVRLDIRGSGDSDGLILDEYLKQEQDDAVEAIAWIARAALVHRQGRDDGHLLGRLQRAPGGRAPPEALKAIISVCSTDDRYADDMHYMGGACSTEISNGARLLLSCRRAPDPRIVGENGGRSGWTGWSSRALHAIWMRHQRRDEFWQHGSVCEDFAPDQMRRLRRRRLGGRLFQRRSSGCSRNLKCPARALSVPGAINIRITACPGRPSASCRSRCAGGTIG